MPPFSTITSDNAAIATPFPDSSTNATTTNFYSNSNDTIWTPPTSINILPPLEQGGVLVVIVCGAVLVYALVYWAMKIGARSTDMPFDDIMVTYCKWPLLFFFPTLALKIAWPFTGFTRDISDDAFAQHALLICLILEIGWLVLNGFRVWFSYMSTRTRWDGLQDNKKQRKMVTQLAVVKRLTYVIVVFIMASAVVITLPGAWELGLSLLASAGAAGLILGLAAKPGLENMISSLTIAFTQPITIDDEIIVDNEYGRVEEIRSQYVVVRTWDGRRLNWSKTSSWKIGVAFFYFDPLILAHMNDLRERLLTILTNPPANALWDGKVINLAVTDIKDNGIVEVRALTSGRNPSEVFDLRCAVREAMLAYVVRKWPEALVRKRGEVRMFHDSTESWNKGLKMTRRESVKLESLDEYNRPVVMAHHG